jgi:hypothetical protein
MTNMTSTESNDAIKKLITNVKSNLTRYRGYSQDAAIAIIRHAMTFGDCDNMKRMARAMNPKDRPTFINYVASVSPIRVTMGRVESDDKAKLASVGQKTYTPFDLDRAIALKWWEFEVDKPEVELKGVDDYFAALIKTIEAPLKDVTAAKYSPAEIDEVKRIVAGVTSAVSAYRVARIAAKRASEGIGELINPPVAAAA